MVILVPEVEPCNAGGRTEGDRQVVVHFWIRVFSVRVGGEMLANVEDEHAVELFL